MGDGGEQNIWKAAKEKTKSDDGRLSRVTPGSLNPDSESQEDLNGCSANFETQEKPAQITIPNNIIIHKKWRNKNIQC